MFDPALHDALSWAVIKNGVRWRRIFKSQDAAQRALGRNQLKPCYRIVPAAWSHKPPSRKTGIHILWTKDAAR